MTDKPPIVLKTYKLYWEPEGRVIKIVRAENAYKAKRLAPAPYVKYQGEIYAEELVS